jgi:hypothetical protein
MMFASLVDRTFDRMLAYSETVFYVTIIMAVVKDYSPEDSHVPKYARPK